MVKKRKRYFRRDRSCRNGKVKDLVLPIVFLIVSCIVAMLYTGGLFKGESVVDAFANCSSSRALVLGSFFTIIFTFLLYVPRKVISFSDFAAVLRMVLKQ